MKKGTEKEKVVLSAQARTVLGKKNKQLRKQGLLPANVFGPDFASQSLSVNYVEFRRIFRHVGETGVVYLKTEKDEIPTLITAIQRHPLDGTVLHADFRKIDLKKKIEAVVPLTFVGVSPAVNAGGVILTQTDKVTVEALPQDIPNHIEVDISVLKEIGNELKVSDLGTNAAYVITTEPTKVVVSVTAHKEESVVAETTAAAAPEVITAKEGEATAEDGAAAEKTEAKAEDKKA
jgi:large subunit ribosomal protein L25